MAGTVLVLGASGRFGRNAADAFESAGWTVRRFRRDRDDLNRAADGADVIVNGWNPPYTHWASELPGLTDQVIAAARSSRATVIFPGNVYVYGDRSPELLGPDTPHTATNPLGRLRIAVEAAYRDSGVQTIVLRAGDFLDTAASGNWFDQVMIKKIGKGRLVYPGDPGVPHAWAFLPDMARAAVALAGKRGDLAAFEEVPFPGYTLTGEEMAAVLSTVLGRPIQLTHMSWLPIQIARPFWPMAKHLLEMRYLWSMPHRLDGARFADLLPAFQPTPVETALRQAVEG